ncbi:MAG: hypothetical protein EA404_10150 [Spirochaetaceae bacterium]|nr:MAG: hypothetical protein EA404_10150 [Spirochaetaceae bacterium]
MIETKKRRLSLVLPVLPIVCTILVTVACAGAPVRANSAPAEDIRVELVEWARLAQSAHNYQPWRVVLDPVRSDRMKVFVESERLLPQTDPYARQTVISVGAFLAVIEARAARLGYQADIELLPDGDLDDEDLARLPAARITLLPSTEARSDFAAAADVDALTTATVKYRYRPAELDPAVVNRITSYASQGIHVNVVTDAGQVAWLNRVSIDAFTVEMQHKPTLTETHESTRWNGRARRQDPYGLAFTANFPLRTLWLTDAFMTVAPQKPEAFGRTGIRLFTRALEDITTYITLITDDNSRRTQIETGMVLQTIWMELHAADHVVLANSQALQEYSRMEPLYAEVHGRLAPGGGTVQMLLAVTRPRGGTHRFSPRFAAVDLITR